MLTLDQEKQPGLQHWLLVPIFLVVVLCAAILFSNANTHLALKQRPGNLHDDAKLTHVLNEAGSLEDVQNNIKFAYYHVVPAYLLNELFDLQTKGRRFIAAAILLTSLIYLLFIMARYRVLDGVGLLATAFLFSIAGGLTQEALNGLLGLPLLVLLSVCLVHILFHFYDRPFSKWNCFVISMMFMLVVLMHYRIVVGVCAVAFVLTFGDAVSKRPAFREFLFRSVILAAILLVPLLIVGYFLFFQTHSELLNPRRGLNNYFLMSDYASDLSGAFLFFYDHSVRLFLSAMSPAPAWGRSLNTNWLNWFLGGFFLVGLVFSKNTRVFPFALFFIVGTLAHIALNLVSLVPYGGLRYFLPFFIAYPVIIAAGISMVSKAIVQTFKSRLKISTFAFQILLTIVALGILGSYYYAIDQRNKMVNQKMSNSMNLIRLARTERNAALVLDAWTSDDLIANQSDIIFGDPYVFLSSQRTKWTGEEPDNVDDIIKWKNYLSTQSAVAVITSIPFTEANYGQLYRIAADKFKIDNLPSVPVYNFALFSQRKGQRNPLDNGFDLLKWKVTEGVSVEKRLPTVFSKKFQSSSYRVSFEGVTDDGRTGDSKLVWAYPKSFRSGQSVGVTMYVWADEEMDLQKNLVLQIARNDGGAKDFANRRISVISKEPEKMNSNLTFKHDHESVKVAIIYLGKKPLKINVLVSELRF